jgi:simple sugar transport system permease protein
MSLLVASVDFLGTSDFWDSVIRVSVPIALTALAATLCARAGVLFIAIEGVMLFAAFFAIAGVVWTGSTWLGVLVAAGAGVVGALFFGVLSMGLRMGDAMGGLVCHIGAFGLAGFLLEELFPLGLTTGAKKLTPLWGEFGNGLTEVLFVQQPLVYIAIAIAVCLQLFLRTKWGLVVRASGESMPAAMSFGVSLPRLRYTVLAVAGLITGLAGADMGIVLAGTFNTDVTGGRGFIGLACVVLGAWQPLGAAAAVSVFGFAYALQFRVGNSGGWIQTLPYLVALALIALFWGRARGPAEEGKGLPEKA